MMYAIVDLVQKQFLVARAGHNSLLVKSGNDGEVQRITPKGIGIGLDAGPVFEKMIGEKLIPIKSGDRFLFYTDGISEAMNDRREEFGEERLVSVIQKSNPKSAIETRQLIIREIESFVQEVTRHDDMTMINLNII